MNSEIPAPGSKGIAVIRNDRDGVELVEVHLIDPSGLRTLTMPGEQFGVSKFPDAVTVRREVGAAIANNPVWVVNVDDDDAE